MQKNKSFSVALAHIKTGGKAKRSNWNGQDQYIYVSNKVIIQDSDGNEIIAENDCFGSKVIVFVNQKLGHQVGWLASQADMLAEDWVLL